MRIEAKAREAGWPFWIDIWPECGGAICLRLDDAKRLLTELQIAIDFVERREREQLIREAVEMAREREQYEIYHEQRMKDLMK